MTYFKIYSIKTTPMSSRNLQFIYNEFLLFVFLKFVKLPQNKVSTLSCRTKWISSDSIRVTHTIGVGGREKFLREPEGPDPLRLARRSTLSTKYSLLTRTTAGRSHR